MILVKTFFAYNELRNYSYLITDDATGFSWVIDPYEADPMIDYIKKNGLVLKGILNTHQHFDHIRGNASLSESLAAPVFKLKHSDTLQLGDRFFLETLDTPGHTLDHQAFLWKEGAKPLALFSGDTLFNSGVGNCRGGGDVNELFITTNHLKELPSATLLYPGHDYRKRNLEFAQKVEPENPKVREALRSLGDQNTEDLSPVTLGEEREVNPFFRLDSEEIKQNILKRDKPLFGAEEDKRELFRQLRQLRDQW